MEKLLLIAKKYPHNWDEKLLDFLAEELNITRVALHLVLPKGLENLVDYYLLQIESSLSADSISSIQTRVYQLMLSIFTQLDQEKNVSLKILNAPISLSSKMRIVWRGSKKIWDLVDIASDFSYYSRIASLAGIYSRNLLTFRDNGDWKSSLERDFSKIGQLIKCKKACSFFSY